MSEEWSVFDDEEEWIRETVRLLNLEKFGSVDRSIRLTAHGEKEYLVRRAEVGFVHIDVKAEEIEDGVRVSLIPSEVEEGGLEDEAKD